MTATPQFNIQIGDALTCNVQPLLHEIRHALVNLAEHDRASIIDLRSIPLAPGEEDKIVDTLGAGEVHARLDSLGASEILETRYPGVWLITHYNIEDEIISRFIEITTIPEILRSQPDDIRDAHAQLSEFLDRARQDQPPSVETTP